MGTGLGMRTEMGMGMGTEPFQDWESTGNETGNDTETGRAPG